MLEVVALAPHTSTQQYPSQKSEKGEHGNANLNRWHILV